MGAAATKKEEKEAKTRAIRTKVKAIAAFNPIPGKRDKGGTESSSSTDRGESKRDELLQFIKERREEKLEVWDNLQKGYDAGNLPVKAGSMIEIPDLNDEVDVTTCGMCSETDIWRMLSCRVCGRKYHRKCLTGSGLFTDHEMGFFDRAETAIGWSCLRCDNIFNLLTSTELDELSNDFDRLDLNKDASISVDEYLEHRKQLFRDENGREMTDHEEQFERLQFEYLDADGGGTVEYSEYLKHHACIRLATRPKEELVALLTPREKLYAQQVFTALDRDNLGHVTVVEAQLAYRSWYTGLFGDMMDQGRVSRNAVNGLSDLKASLIVDLGDTSSKAMDWEEFLGNRAIYLISSRPNNVAALCEKNE